MKKLLLILVLAVPVFARVISYAPYTNRTATPGYHERMTRYFVLLERNETGGWPVWPSQVVLYDSSGVDEPRVIYPQSDDDAPVTFAALYEPKTIAAPLARAWILIGAGSKLLFSSNSGVTWNEVGGLNPTVQPSLSVPHDVDIGGPFTRGLANQVQLGTDPYPFVVAYNRFVVRIDSSGTAQTLLETADGSHPSLLGRNAAGDRILVRSNGAIRILKLGGGVSATVLTRTDPNAQYSGWVLNDDTAYLQMLRPEGRFLYIASSRFPAEFIQGPFDTPPPAIGAPVQYLDTSRFFAVPTHDFQGAWMIRRAPGKPTTLSRHRLNFALETMWSDVSGPQVEALIPGRLGDKVLVQVHRERNVALDRPFIDPALAVWHVGDPAPRTYDELYLNESWSKGFVHVDVDQMESGTPFVFNSGFQEAVPDIIVSPAPPPGGGGDVIQEWGVVRASLKQHLVFPGVARLRGAFDSYWLTDVTISNPFEETQDVEIRFVALGENVTALGTESKTITLNAGEIRLISDALKTLFNIESGGGALHFLPEVAVSVTGRTYTRNPEGGTLGFGMQAIDFFNAAGPRFPLTFSGAFPGEHFRTNILLTDTSGRGSAAEINAFGLVGAMGTSNFEITSPINGVTQFNGLGAPLGLFSSESGGLRVRPTRGTMIPTVVAIDNRTNDPTYFPPDIPASVPRMIPVIGHLDGVNGAKFRSDLYLLNPMNDVRSIALEAKSWDSAQRKNLVLTMLPNEARVIPDVLSTMFGMTGLARLHFQTQIPGEGIRATSRTYTVEPGGATYGCLIPPLNNFQIAAPGASLEILGVNAGTDFRVNLGLVELSRNDTAGAANVRVSILDETSKTIDTFTIAVPKTGGLQINNIFGARGITPPNAAMIVVENIGGNPGGLNVGLIGAYATLTDNKTNDSTFLGAQLGAQPN